MVVVAIIGILALLGLRVYSGQQDKAKNAIIKANAGTVQTLAQADLADNINLTNESAVSKGAGAGLRNPFGGTVVVYSIGTDGTVTPDNTGTEGAVGVLGGYGSGEKGPFKIVGYGKDGAIIPNYELTARP